jgi:hypothetical protein
LLLFLVDPFLYQGDNVPGGLPFYLVNPGFVYILPQGFNLFFKGGNIFVDFVKNRNWLFT